jgi:hypothetical protein
VKHCRSLFVPFVLLVVSCATTGGWNSQPPTSVIGKVLATGRSLVGQKPQAQVQVNGRPFTLDCIGTVSAAWWGAGVDLQRDFHRYRGDGVNRLYQSLKSWGALHWFRTPQPGDLIIWDHTWDTGDDPNYPDGHTHAGLVLSVESDGTIAYLHESVTRGVVVAYLNLYDPAATRTPDGRVLNSPMFLGSGFGRDNNPPLWTSGQPWSAFGDGSTVVRALAGS